MAILSEAYLTLGPLASMQIDANSAAEGFSSCRFDWNGATDIPCTSKPLKQGSELDIGGWQKMQHVKVAVRVESLPDSETYPEPKHNIVLYLSADGAGHRLKILNVENSEDALLILECVDSNHPVN
jgi:hypothetical protein